MGTWESGVREIGFRERQLELGGGTEGSCGNLLESMKLMLMMISNNGDMESHLASLAARQSFQQQN